MKVYTKALAAIRRGQMLPPDTAVVVGLSGGADSVALLHLLLSLREELSLSAVTALHVNHGLRGEEAVRDQRFVEQLCERLDVPLTVCCRDVAALAAQQRIGVEEAGRIVRYRELEKAADDFPACRIATAHTASDNIETLLLHLCRGSGLHGLAGIPPVRGRVVRPLIDCTREEIEAYCEEHGLTYVTDSTNTDPSYARNRIRQLVVPQLKAINPQAETAIGRVIARAREWDLDVTAQARVLLSEAALGENLYRRSVLWQSEPAVRAAAIRSLLGDRGEQRGSEVHIRKVTELLETGGSMTISGSRQLTVEGEMVRICEAATALTPFRLDGVKPDDEWCIGGERWCLRLFSREEYEQKLNISKILFANALDYGKISDSLCIRQRLPGDAFHPVGRGCGKTLKKLFNEAALSAAEREAIPLLCDSRGIVLVAGFGCDERVRITDTTADVLWMGKTEDV
ncbi:MAG: tRNA lysidine(34) synthetase TilS [Clostridia bacterium]|nr:tRNA lysidine(34) synthetase TilS [Clostridia bacterium]